MDYILSHKVKEAILNDPTSFRGGYFMSEEAEKAAKWQLVENYNAANGAFEALKEQAAMIGEALSCICCRS
jgi:hypothetical protein